MGSPIKTNGTEAQTTEAEADERQQVHKEEEEEEEEEEQRGEQQKLHDCIQIEPIVRWPAPSHGPPPPRSTPHASAAGPQLQLGDFVGEHGAYQLALTLILFARYVLLGLMANSGPLLTPDVTFYCRLPMGEVLEIMPNISSLSRLEQETEIREEFKRICQIDLHLYHNQSNLWPPPPSVSLIKQLENSNDTTNTTTKYAQQVPGSSQMALAVANGSHIRECTQFTYDQAPDQGRTMTGEFDLVCDRDWLRSLFQSLISAAIVVAHVFWGTFSDRYGRFQAQRLCLLVSLLAGLLSVFALDFWTFTLARALCSLGDLGLVVSITTTVVELVGSKYRGLSVALVNFGYALGVALLPYIVAYFEDFRLVVGFTVLCHLVTAPLILATSDESIRWLLTNRKYNAARRELKRIERWNRNYALAKLWLRLQLSNWCCCLCFWCCFSSNSEWANKIGGSGGAFAKLRARHAEANKLSRLIVGAGGQARRSQRLAFERKFNLFVSQTEAHNLHNPLADLALAEASVFEPVQLEGELEGRLSSETGEAQAQTAPPPPPVAVHQQQPQFQQQQQQVAEACQQQLLPSRPSPTTCGGGGAQQATGAVRAASCEDMLNSRPPPRRAGHAHQECQEQRNRTLPLTGAPPTEAAATVDQPMRLTWAASAANKEHDDEDHGGEYNLNRRHHHHHHNQADCINLVAHQLSFMGRVSRLFKDKRLMVAVFTIVWTTFNSELQYTSYIIINLEVGEDVYLNYILGGCMEALAAITASLLLSYSPRRLSLIAFWLLISLSCFGLSIAHIDSTWAVWLLALAKFSQSCLSSIASVAAYESFPTALRQSGSGLVFTLGMLGSVFAPLIFAEFDDQTGMDRVLMTFSVSSLTAAILIYLFLDETRDRELE